LSDPFPVSSAGVTLPAISDASNFAQKGHQLQTQGYLIYQFFEHENNTTPYMTGTYLGTKKVFNIAIGGMLQNDAMWKKGAANDTLYQAMKHVAIESFLDMPVNKAKGTAISAYAGYFITNYGTNYLRYNGIMNPANGTTLSASNSISGQGPVYGNAVPMFGTGKVFYTQLGFLLPADLIKKGQFMPYASATLASYDRLNDHPTNTFNAGINYLIAGHKAKITLDWQNRPTYAVENGTIENAARRNSLTMQYQILF
jgi:hypothetical protein